MYDDLKFYHVLSITYYTSWRSLKNRHELLDPWRFETVIECPRAPEAQPKPIFYDENKQNKHHGFNYHVTQCPHVDMAIDMDGEDDMAWHGTDMTDDEALTWPMMWSWHRKLWWQGQRGCLCAFQPIKEAHQISTRSNSQPIHHSNILAQMT